MIDFKGVSIEYEPGVPVIQNANLHIYQGERVGLIGANGAGKSTIMSGILGLVDITGELAVDNILASKKNLPEIRKKVGLVLQNSDNQMFMPTVFEDMMFAPLNYHVSKENAEKYVDEVLDSMGIKGLKHRHNHKLSGGEKKMAAIATILVMNPQVILLDEPTATLDPYNRRQIIKLIKDINQTSVIASHDLDMILDTCDRVILISEGKIVADGSTEEILRNQELLEANHLELPLRFQH